MELTKEQIQELYQFTKKKHVDWYELQTELVDHLANEIETAWKENPKLSFIKARNNAYMQFGIFGFGEVVEQKVRALYKNYWLLIWNHFKAYFKLPKIILILFLTAVLYLLFDFILNKDLLLNICFALILFVPFTLSIYNLITVKLRERKTKKKWMFESIIYSYGGLIHLIIQVPFYIYNDYTIIWSSQNQLIASFLVAIGSIFSYLIVLVIPEKIKESVIKLHPEYQLH